MNLLCCLFSLVLSQITCAQVVPYMQRNGIAAANANAIAATQSLNAIAANANIAGTPGILANLPANGLTNAIASNANAQIANVINENAAIFAANQDVASAITNANLANIASANLGNGATNANLAALASANLANINGNMATFDLGNGFSLTSGSPASPGFGIQVLADALEVGGTVAVNGKMPIFGTVAINGVVPTDGSASVSFNCGPPNVK